MDKRFSSLFNITEERAIKLLQTPLEELEDESDRYAAASHLAYFKSDRSIKALIEAIKTCDDQLYNRITRRKAIETLGKFKASEALDIIIDCLDDPDCYTVENAVWAIGEIGTEDSQVLDSMTSILNRAGQKYRVIIQTLAKLHYAPAVATIENFVNDPDLCIASSAISSIARLTNDYSQVDRVVELLQSDSVNARRASIQDLMDLNYYQAIESIVACPVSLVFRLRAVRHLGNYAMEQGLQTFADIEPFLDKVVLDYPDTLSFVHEYDQSPPLEFLINELYHTDFGRCYLASHTLLEEHRDILGEALVKTYEAEAYNDYGGHFHVMKLFGWIKYQPARNILLEALDNTAPQFQKSRGAAAIALGKLGHTEDIAKIKAGLETKIFDLNYGCLLALKEFGIGVNPEEIANTDPFIQAKAKSISVVNK